MTMREPARIDAHASPAHQAATPACPVCRGATTWAGTKTSGFSGRQFQLTRCVVCRYVFVTEPRTDFADLYDAAYYSGGGADSNVDYEREISDPKTIRLYEWRGILRAVSSFVDIGPGTRWLDFGCGLGGFVRYARSRGVDALGYEEGYAATRMRDLGIPMLANLVDGRGAFDVVTGTEVIEHAVDPVAVLRTMSSLLREGGALFLTTGNAAPHERRLTEWKYLEPIDVHVGFFEPGTLAHAMRRAGLDPAWLGYRRGHTNIIRHKVLKALGVHRRHVLDRLVPWPLASRLVDWRHGVSDHPIGRRAKPSGPGDDEP